MLGAGLIGGSVGKALISRGICREVVGYFRREETMKTALAHGLVTRGTMFLEEAVSGADVVILATGVDAIPSLAECAAVFLQKEALVTDVGSVKGLIIDKVSAALKSRPDVLFAGSHPLYGSHLQGPAAGAELDPAGKLTVVTPAKGRKNAEAAADRAEALWQSIGMRTVRLDPEEHDRLLAFSSHLPHAVAGALARMLPQEADILTATGFLDTTRIAAGSPKLWTEILCANSKAVASALDAMIKDMKAFRKALGKNDREAVARLLEAAATARARLHEQTPREEQ
jgi:prephenate dehydrogenase